jgi:alcohol dehydrogenase YqhD (iron-dependent ADH family)
MKSQLQSKAGRFARLAREVFGVTAGNDEEAALAGSDQLKKWFSSIGSPVSLGEAQIPARDIEKIAENAAALAQVWGLKTYTKEVITDVLKLCV